MAGELAFFTMAALFTILFAGDRISEWRRNKRRQQLETKTPYDYALTNAINERDRLQDELRTIQALKRTEADTERIRNEIGTILSEDGEEVSEDVYGGLNGIPIVRHSDGTISPFPRWDGMSTEEAAWDAGAVARAYQANVREVDAEAERLTEDDVERSLTKVVRESFKNNQGIRVFWEDSHGRTRAHYGSVDEIESANGKVRYFSVWGLGVSARDVLRITKGRSVDGETLYRKGGEHNVHRI